MTSFDLDEFVAAGIFSNFDRYFAERLAAIVQGANQEVLFGAALASRAIVHGHVCVDLANLTGSKLTAADDTSSELSIPQSEILTKKLRESPLVGDGTRKTPLVLQKDRLYLHRYWQYENRLAEQLSNRSGRFSEVFDQALLADGLERLFPHDENYSSTAQRRSAEIAVQRMLTIISGGPGTGKTTTIVKILVLLQEQALAKGGNPLNILLLAPTGKAAARLTQSVLDKISFLKTNLTVKKNIPTQASTIHRALGYQASSPTRFRHDLENPLKVDAVFIDEASMVDIALMAKLFDAIPEKARIVLLGDHHQLVSVEAGSILGDIYDAAQQRDISLSDCVTSLDTSYRFDSDRDIGALIEAINRGDGDRVISLLHDEAQQTIALRPFVDQVGGGGALREEIIGGYGDYLKAASPLEALRGFERFQILCAHRQGKGGVKQLNAFAEDILTQAGLLATSGTWYKGRPVMITSNNYSLRLFNGDIGIVWPDSDDKEALKVYFTGNTRDELRSFLPWRLPQHETAFAMTIHKSQGSEFDKVVIILPPESSPILTRELIYTGVSRARAGVSIFSSEHVLRQAILHTIERASGLIDKLCRPD